MWSLERNEPLKACPVMSCRRQHTCLNAGAGGACARTHYLCKDEWLDELTAMITAHNDKYNSGSAEQNVPSEANASAFYKALKERAQELGLL